MTRASAAQEPKPAFKSRVINIVFKELRDLRLFQVSP